MNITSSDVQASEYKHLNIKSSDSMHAFMKLKVLDYLGFHKYPEEIGYDFIGLELIDIDHELELYITIKNYKNDLK